MTHRGVDVAERRERLAVRHRPIVLEERSVVRHHAMRRTLWIMDTGLAGAAHEACTRAIAHRSNEN
jgi:hypothetical protein